MNQQKPKILILFSGGLDSRLVVKLMQEKGYEVIALRFKLPFSKLLQDDFLKNNKIKEEIINCTKGKLLQEYLEIIKKPKFGRGTAINPCMDCKIFMFKKAKQYANKNKIEIIATGEVKGQRPMSQTSKALAKIDADLGFKIIRPLIELGIEGRSRKKQIELAKKYQISYPTPAGGCLLCEPEFCKKLKPLLDKKITEQDIELIKIGRHFENNSIILGKNEKENIKLEKIKEKYKTEKLILIVPEQPGPSALIKDKKYLEQAKSLIKKYSKHNIADFLVK